MEIGGENVQKIILASASPRRAELLKQIGIKFEVMVSDAKEEMLDLSPGELAQNTAFQKAKLISRAGADSIIIAADTIVAVDGHKLGKPSDNKHAAEMLKMLSGRCHEVYTGLCVLEKPSGRYFLGHECTKVYFRELSQAEIEAYVSTGEPLDKAGAYGIQGKGALLVEKIEGCYFNVVGLPLTLLYKTLKEFGIEILK